MLELKIESEYIKLDQFLKLADIASTGGHAKYLIKLSIRDSMMAITSNNEKGNVYEEVSLSLEGDYLDIAFNSRYLLEGLKNIDCEEIFIEFTTNVNPCIIKPADGTKYTYLLLPVRISSNN